MLWLDSVYQVWTEMQWNIYFLLFWEILLTEMTTRNYTAYINILTLDWNLHKIILKKKKKEKESQFPIYSLMLTKVVTVTLNIYGNNSLP